MLRIRREQYEVFAAAARERFEREARAFLEECWAEECAALGEEGVLELLRGTVELGQQHGIEREGELLRLMNVVMALGGELDPDEHAFVGEILERAGSTPAARLDAIEARVSEELARSAGEAPA